MVCEFETRCIRCAYSRFFQKEGYTIPPKRFDLFLKGYISALMMTNAAIFAEKLPLTINGQSVNLCPVMVGQNVETCYEYQKEKRKQDRKKIARHGSRPRVFLSPVLRKQIAERDNYQCVYCGIFAGQYRNGERVKCVIDHYIPLCDGGAEADPDNLVFCCWDCNNAKRASLWPKGCRVNFY